MLGIGGFNPLDGFMGKADWEGVCDNMTIFDMSNPILNLKDKIIPIATLLMALFFL
jgi:ATP sulfurylase